MVKQPRKPKPSTAADLEAKLRVLADAIPELRAAGVTSLTIEGVSVTIEPPAPDISALARMPAPKEEDDFLHPSKFRSSRVDDADLEDWNTGGGD